jgi:hypothetical protein
VALKSTCWTQLNGEPFSNTSHVTLVAESSPGGLPHTHCIAWCTGKTPCFRACGMLPEAPAPSLLHTYLWHSCTICSVLSPACSPHISESSVPLSRIASKDASWY